MWANIGFVCVGLGVAGAVATTGYLYWDKMMNMEGMEGLKSILQNIEAALELDLFIEGIRITKVTPLTEDELKYKTYESTDAGTGEEMTFGKKYEKLLVEDKQDNNYDWWKENFKKKKDKITTEEVDVFSGITKDTSEDEAPSQIKDKCKTVYDKKLKELKKGDITNAWLLCSPISHAPGSVLRRGKYSGKIASEDEYKPFLLEDRKGNYHAWQVMFEKYYKNKQETKDDLFNSITSGYPQETENKEATPKTLNQVCFEAYQKTKDEVETNENLKNNIIKFCSFSTIKTNTSSTQA